MKRILDFLQSLFGTAIPMRKLSFVQTKLSLFDGGAIPLSLSDFLADAGTIEFEAPDGFLHNKISIFKLEHPDYKFEAKIADGRVSIRRGDLYQRSDQCLDRDSYNVAIQWDVNSIGCGIASIARGEDMDKKMFAVKTPYTTPPLGFKRDVKCGAPNNSKPYASIEELYARVLDCLAFCEKDIRRYGAEKFIWGEKDGKFHPENEPEITRFIASYLEIYGSVNEFTVSCESQTGGGKLDFCIYGNVFDIGLVKIAIEAKKANSADIERGFTHQLPEYMKRLDTTYGIYLVYWLKSERFPYPPTFDSYPYFEIGMLHPLLRDGHVRTVGINLAFENSPSRL